MKAQHAGGVITNISYNISQLGGCMGHLATVAEPIITAALKFATLAACLS